MKTQKLTLSAILTALAVVFIYFSQFAPSGKLALAAIACLCTTVVVAETGPAYALVSYAAASVLGLLLAPTYGLLYIALFGWYPSAKCIIERLRSPIVQWIIKLCCFNAAFGALYVFAQELASTIFGQKWVGLLLFAAANVIFVLVDIVLTKFIAYYAGVLRPRIIKNR